MITDDKLLDASDDMILANNTPQEESPRTFSRCLINSLGISSKEGATQTINNTQAMNNVTIQCLIVIYCFILNKVLLM